MKMRNRCVLSSVSLMLFLSRHVGVVAAKNSLSFVPVPPALISGRIDKNEPTSSPLLARGGGMENEKSGKETDHSRVSPSEGELSPCCDLPSVWNKHDKNIKRGLILMDVFSIYHSGYLSKMAREAYGVGVAYVLSDYMKGYFQIRKQELDESAPMEEVERVNVELMKQLPSLNKTKEWMDQLPFDEIVGIICETDSGLPDAERWGDRLNVTHTNGINEARRDKFLMNKAVGEYGLDVVQQKLCRSREQAVEFANELRIRIEGIAVDRGGSDDINKIGKLGMEKIASTAQPLRKPICVVKPVRGVASDNVFLCRDIHEVESAFDTVHGSTVFGSPREKHDTVLVQEFASGTEYAIDVVSKNGHHKIGALWQYDKRRANGAHFVYHATELVDADTEIGRAVYDYIAKTLDALGIRWGMTHCEVIVDSTGKPRLVEVNCRQHNTDFAPLTMFCIGYNVLDMLLSAYLENSFNEVSDDAVLDEGQPPPIRLQWDSLPDLASPRVHGAIVHLVNHADGILMGLNEAALDEIERMESVAALEIYPHFMDLGHHIAPTVDIRTDAGWIHLVNHDARAFRRDYERIVDLMPRLFLVSESNTLGELGE